MQRNISVEGGVSNETNLNTDGILMSKKAIVASLTALACIAAGTAHAQDSGDWLLRLRALHLNSANNDDTGLGLSVNDKWFPELDVSYFLTPNWAAELVLTYPQRHDLRLAGNKIGTLKHLPPTLSLQYHLTGFEGIRPYAGVGVNYTHFSSVDLAPGVDIGRSSVGPAVGLGADMPVGGGWLLNIDAKKVWLDTEVKVGGARVGKFGVDPWLFSLGVGKRF